MSAAVGDRRFSILLICDTYPPVLGGSEIEAQRVCRALILRGHRVEVLCSGGPPMPARRNWVDPAGVPVTILTRHSRGRWKDIVFAIEAAWTIWRWRKNIDLVYFLMQGLHLAAGLPVARMAGKPMVMKISGDGIVTAMRRSRAGRLELGWLRRWRVPVMVLNDAMIEEALTDGFARDQLVWMPNPVDPDEFRPARAGESEAWRESHGIPAHAHVVIYVGRLSHEKGLRPLIGGFARAAKKAPDALLLLVGDGALRPELETLTRELGINAGQIRFAGRVPAGEIPFWLRASDIYSLTSPSEGFPCALLEAMSAGVPSVVSAIPANLQLIDEGVHGLTVPFDDEVAIGEAFLKLFADARLRKSMGNAARQRVVDNYSTDKVIDRYEALFDGLTY